MASSPSPLLLLGLDVGDGRLLDEWARAGSLPNFERLRREGTFASLSTPADVLHVSGWPSLYTGCLPGEHGVYYTHQPAPGHQGARPFQPDQYGVPPCWAELDRQGIPCILFDAPYTSLVPGFRGVQILEWGTWAHYTEPVTSPSGIADRLRQHVGSYPLRWEANRIGLVALDPAAVRRELLPAVQAKTRAIRWLLKNEPWQFCFAVYGETHPAAHYLWPAAESTGKDLADLKAVYAEIDRGLGELLAVVPEGTTVAVVSTDGVGPNIAGWHLLPRILEGLGFSVPPGARDDAAPPRKSVVSRLRDLLPNDLRQAVSRYLPASLRESLRKRKAAESVDWSRSVAYCLPTDLEGCIRINQQGREPQGIVPPGSPFDEVCEQIRAGLLDLKHPDSGDPLVRDVIRCQDVFPGPRQGSLPDLIVRWTTDRPIRAAAGETIGTVSAPSPDQRTGTHQGAGFLLVCGPGVPAGHVHEGAEVVHLAATILRHFDRERTATGPLLWPMNDH